MVPGIEIFSKHFTKYVEQFVLIGGSACAAVLEANGIEARSTKDLDIVLYVEALTPEFVGEFWKFIDLGRYSHLQKGETTQQFYRFSDPEDTSFPKVIELFSKSLGAFDVVNDRRYTKISVGEEVVSLSAILLIDEYYELCKEGRVVLDGMSYLSEYYLIPMKMRAWIDLSTKKSEGAPISRGDVRKHRNDIVRLVQIVDPKRTVPLHDMVLKDMRKGVEMLKSDTSLILADLGLSNQTIDDVAMILLGIYRAKDIS